MTDSANRKPQHGPRGGPYANDPRVVRDEGKRGYRIPSDDGDDWHIQRPTYGGGGFTALSDQGQVAMDPTDRHCRRLQIFATADEGIGYILGDPQGPRDE